MKDKRQSRLRRAKRTRKKIESLRVPRLQVHRTLNHVYANLLEFADQGTKVIASASTMDKTLREKVKGNKSEKARQIGLAIAERAKAKGVTKVAFDRSGFKYHGRVKALAEGAREGGMEF